MRLFYALVVVVFVSTFAIIVSIPPETKKIHVVTYSWKDHPVPSRRNGQSPGADNAASAKAKSEISLRQKPHDYEAITTKQFLREQNAILAGRHSGATAKRPLQPNAPEICMAGFIAIFQWSENPQGGESVMGVYLHPEETGRPVHIFKSQYGKLRCRVDGRRMIWANYNGRWRNHPLDPKLTYEVGSAAIRITETHQDGSANSTEHSLKKLNRLTDVASTKQRYLKVEKNLSIYKNKFSSQVETTNRKPVLSAPVDLSAPRQKKSFLEEFQDNWKAYKQKERRKADRRTDQICDSVYDTFGSADEYFRGVKCKQKYRKQHRVIYE